MPNTKFILEDDLCPSPQSDEGYKLILDSFSDVCESDTNWETEVSSINTTNNFLPSNEIGNVYKKCVSLTSTNDLGKDKISGILSLILISTKDLLTSRLVSKLWRDVATEILLQRESCFIALCIEKIWVPEDDNNWLKYIFSVDVVDKYGQKKTVLSELTESIQNSPQFPASHLHIHADFFCATNHDEFPDLIQLFQLYGRQIKTLCYYGALFVTDLWDILLSYAPGLECLDLGRAKLQFSHKKSNYSRFSKQRALKEARSHTLTAIVFRSEDDNAFGELIQDLLSFPSNLRRIENVNFRALAPIHMKEKTHLIDSFEFEYMMDCDTFKRHYSLMKQLSNASPKLSTLVLNLKEPKLYNAIVASVNAILESSKDTLQELHVSIIPLEYRIKLKIPRIKNLKSITLNPKPLTYLEVCAHKHKPEWGQTSVFLVNDSLCGPKYFPSLVNVTLKEQDFRKGKENLLSFFNFHSHQEADLNRNRNYFPTVTALKILGLSRWPTLSMAQRISFLFPNVRVMKISWHSFDLGELKGNLWVTGPLVECMEIYNVTSPDHQNDSTTCIDVIFTGFSWDIITKLRTANEIPQSMNNPGAWDFLRTTPSICHLRQLKEFKLKFSQGSLTQFASKVTGIYAFLANAVYKIYYFL